MGIPKKFGGVRNPLQSIETLNAPESLDLRQRCLRLLILLNTDLNCEKYEETSLIITRWGDSPTTTKENVMLYAIWFTGFIAALIPMLADYLADNPGRTTCEEIWAIVVLSLVWPFVLIYAIKEILSRRPR
jgi:hypothetical protein